MNSLESGDRPFLDIPRLPGEPKLAGVPHTRGESLFAEEGLVDGLELSYATYGLPSKRRRSVQDEMIRGYHRSKTSLNDVQSGLEAVGEYHANSDMARHALFMAGVVAGQIEKETTTEETSRPEVSNSYAMPAPFERTDATVRARILAIGGEQFDPTADMNDDKYMRNLVSPLVRSIDGEDPTIIEAGALLFHRYNNPANDITDAIEQFTHLAVAIDRVKVKSIGFKAPTAISNQIIAAAGIALVHAYPERQKSQPAIQMYSTLLAVESPVSYGWLKTKLELLIQQYNHKGQLTSYLNRFIQSDETWQVEDSLHEHADELKSLADDTMDELREFRAYGLKPAYTSEAGATLGDNESWVIEEPHALATAGVDTERKLVMPNIVNFVLADTAKPSTLARELSIVNYANHGRRAGTSYGFGMNLLLGMFADGELKFVNNSDVMSIRGDFEARGLHGTYEYLRLVLIKQLYDLTVPAGFIAELPTLEGEGKSRLFNDKTDRLSEITDLMVPRLKLLRTQKAAIHAAIQSEQLAKSDLTAASTRW